MAEEAVPASTEPIQSNEQAQEEISEVSTEAPEETEKPISYSGTRHKVKVDDKEEEIDYDELVKGYQKGKAGDKRLREAAQLRQNVEALLKNLKSGDHGNLVKLLGKDTAKKMAEKLLLEEIEYEELPEHEKTIRQLQREKEEYESKLKEQETQRQTLERQRLEKEAGDKIQQDMVDAVQKAGVKPTPRVFARMAEYMEAYHHANNKMLPAKEALNIVREEVPKEYFAFTDSLTDDALIDHVKQLPKRVLDAVRKDAVKSVLSQNPVGKGTDKNETPTPRKSKEADRRMTTDDWFNRMEQRLRG